MRKIYGPIQERKCWRIRANKKIKDILQVEDTVKFIKSWALCLFGAHLDMCGKSCHHRSLNPKYFIFHIKYIRVLKFVNCSIWDFSFSWQFQYLLTLFLGAGVVGGLVVVMGGWYQQIRKKLCVWLGKLGSPCPQLLQKSLWLHWSFVFH